MTCHIFKKFDLAEIIAHCLMSLMHFTIHFWPSVTLRTSARYPDTSEKIIINPGWKDLVKSSQLYLTLSTLDSAFLLVKTLSITSSSVTGSYQCLYDYLSDNKRIHVVLEMTLPA